jgi:hypothetical protein
LLELLAAPWTSALGRLSYVHTHTTPWDTPFQQTVRIPALAPIEEEIEIPPPAPIDFAPIVPAAAAEPGAEAAAGAEEADAQANARANAQANAQANARAGGAAEAELQPEEPGAQQEPLEPHAEPEEEEEELLWTRIRTGLNRLRRSMGGLSSGDEEWEPEAQHEPEEPEEPQVEPEAQQEPQIEAEAPAGPEGRPGAEPEAEHVPQPEPEVEAGAAAGSTRGTRQKPQPKAAGKSSKSQRGPKSPPAAVPIRKSPRITKTGEPLLKSEFVGGKPIAVPYKRSQELTPPGQAGSSTGAERVSSPESTTGMQLPTSGRKEPGGPPLSASGLAALARAAARVAAAAAPPPGSNGLTLLAEAATSLAAPEEPVPAGAPAGVPSSPSSGVDVPAPSPGAGVPQASVPQTGVPLSAPEAGAPPASAPEAGAPGLGGLPQASGGVPAAQQGADNESWADTGSPRRDQCEEGEWIEEWKERRGNGLVLIYRGIVNEYGDVIRKKMIKAYREPGHLTGRDLELERYQSMIDGTFLVDRPHEELEDVHEETDVPRRPAVPMSWRKTKFEIGYRAWSSDTEQALYRVMRRLDTLQQVDILVSRYVEGELVEGAGIPENIGSQELVAFDMPSEWLQEFFDATNEDIVIRPPTPPSTESQPTTDVDLPGEDIGPNNWKFRVQVHVDNSIPGVSLVYRSICRWEDNFQINVILTRIVDGQVVQGKPYRGDFQVHYYGDNMPNEFLEAFLQGVKDAEEEERLEAMQAGGTAGVSAGPPVSIAQPVSVAVQVSEGVPVSASIPVSAGLVQETGLPPAIPVCAPVSAATTATQHNSNNNNSNYGNTNNNSSSNNKCTGV